MDIKGFKAKDGTVHKYDYAALANTPEMGEGGEIKSVNNQLPDENGNVKVDVKETMVVTLSSDAQLISKSGNQIANAVANNQSVILKTSTGDIYHLSEIRGGAATNYAYTAVFSRTYISEGNVIREVYAVNPNGSYAFSRETVESSGGNVENGATFTPYVDEEGILSWTNDKDLPNPDPVNIQGPQGKSGKTPERGTDYWTEADKHEIAELAAEMVDAPEGADVTAEAVKTALGYTPANEETVTTLSESIANGWFAIDNLANNWVWKSGYYKSGDGTLVPDYEGFWYSESYVTVEPGQIYAIFDYAKTGKDYTGFGSRGKFTDNTGKFVLGISYASVGGNANGYYVTVPAGATRMYVNAWYDSVEEIDIFVYPVTYLVPLNHTGVSSSNTNLTGKKWASLGDSITYREKWQPYLYRKYNLIHTNCGIGSTCLAGQGTSTLLPFWNDARLAAVKAADPDIVTIMGGANDLANGVTIGDETQFNVAISSKDKNTFIGAYSYIIETLLTWKPTLKIVILGTTWAHNDGKDYSDTLTYTDFSNASRKVAEYYGLPFVDLHAKCGFNKFTMASSPYNIYSDDHIHPNDEGGKIMAAFVDEVFSHLFQF